MTYAIIPVEGPITEADGLPDLPVLQAAVGGYVEVVAARHNTVLWVNEHGKISEPPLPPNPRASYITGLPIVGDTVLTGPADEEGEVTDLSLAARSMLRSLG